MNPEAKPPRSTSNLWTRLLRRAMHQSDDLVVSMEYVDSKGQLTRRVVSPIRFVGKGRFLGLCLGRCEPRQFQLDRCAKISLQPANQFVMPVPIEEIQSTQLGAAT